MKIFRIISGSAFLWCYVVSVGFAATITTSGSGNWSSTTPNAPWPGGTIPATTDDIVVGTGHTLTVDGNRTCRTLSFNSTSGTLSVNTSVVLTVSNAAGVTLNSAAGTSNACTLAGAGVINCVSLSIGSAVIPTAAKTTILTSSVGQINVSGNVTISSYYAAAGGGKENDATFLFGSGTIVVSGIVTTSNGNSTNTSTLNMNTGGGTGTLDLSTAAPISISGTGTSVINFAGSGSTVNYSGAAQTVYATTYKHLTLSGSGVKTVTGVGTINGDLTLSGTVSVAAATAMAIVGHFTLGSGTTFTAGGLTHTIGGNWMNNGGTFNAGTGTITFNVSGTNTIGGTASTTFNTLGIEGCTISLDPNITYNCVNLLLGTTAAAVLTFNTNSVMNVTSNVTVGTSGANRGDFDMTNGGYLKCSTMTNYNGSNTYGTGTVEITGTNAAFCPTGFADWYNLIFSGTSNITFTTATVYIHGNFTMKSGCTVTTAPNYITLYNDWTIEAGATFVPGTGNQAYVVFDGANSQHLYGDVTLYRVWANKTSNNQIILHNTLNVTYGIWWDKGIFGYSGSGLLTLSDGYVELGSVNNATRCIAAPVKKIGDDAYSFPLCAGDGTNYNPMAISDPGTDVNAYYQAQYFSTGFGSYSVTQTPNSIDHVSRKEYWTLDKSGGSNVTVQLFWSTAANSSITNCADLRIAHWNSGISAWENNNDAVTTSGTCSGAGTGNIITNGVVTSYSPFTFASKVGGGLNPLPVELLSFEAKPNQNVVDVTWTTASEKNCDFFAVEKSIDGNSFENVATVDGAGNSSLMLSYASIDHEPYSGISYYRLKQADFNGSFTYSNVVQVEFNSGENVLNVYPAVSSGDFTVSYSGKKDKELLLVIRNLLGQEFYSKGFVIGSSLFIHPINLSGQLPAGVYLLMASNDNSIRMQRIIIK